MAAEHPIRLEVVDDLRRSRLTIFVRLLLAIPHFVWLYLYGIAAALIAFVNWVATLVSGRSPDGLHGFLAGYLRYWTRVTAYVNLLADPFPPFGGGRPRSYPVDLEVDPPARQSRWITGFRLLLAIPAWILAGVLGYVLNIIAFLGWFVCLVLGRMPEGMRNLGAYCLRYQAQTYGYSYVLTQRYPSL